MVRASASQSVDLGYISLVESYQKPLKNCIYSFPAWRSTFREVVENKQASLLVSLGKTLTGRPHLYVEDRWPSYPSGESLWQKGHPTENKCHVKKCRYLLWRPNLE